MNGQIKTLLLLAEDNLENFAMILNEYHFFLSEKLLKILVTRVAATANCTEALPILMNSHAMRSLFFAKVDNSGILRIKGSFEAFFENYLEGASKASKLSA